MIGFLSKKLAIASVQPTRRYDTFDLSRMTDVD